MRLGAPGFRAAAPRGRRKRPLFSGRAEGTRSDFKFQISNLRLKKRAFGTAAKKKIGFAFEDSIIRRRIVLLFAGLVLLALAATIDERTARWVHDRDVARVVRASTWAKIVKAPGDFRFTLGVAAIILAWKLHRWREVVVMLVSGALAGLFYTLVKWSIGRTRPFPQNKPPIAPFELHPFPKGISGLWAADNLSFPSGHASLAFATAASLGMMFPRGPIVFFSLASLVGLERVLENAHYPSDVVGAAIFGILAAWVAAWIVRRIFPPTAELTLLRDGDES